MSSLTPCPTRRTKFAFSILLPCLAVFLWSAPAAQAQVTYGPATQSASNPAFLTGQSVVTTPTSWTITLPNYSTAAFDPVGTFSVSIPVTAMAGQIINAFSMNLTGLFTSPGFVNGTLSWSNFNNVPFSTNASNFSLSFLNPTPITSGVVNLTLNLDSTTGGSAKEQTIRFNFGTTNAPSAVPESSSGLILLALGLAAVAGFARFFGRFRTRSAALATVGVAAIAPIFLSPAANAQGDVRAGIRARIETLAKGQVAQDPTMHMSDMGRIAKIYSQWVERGGSGRVEGNQLVFVPSPYAPTGPDLDRAGDGDPDWALAIPGGQAEYSIAVDSTGQHIVIGFNDTRGFNKSPFQLSGYYYSDDGGATFVDGGSLPPGPTTSLSGTLYPQIFGDPDIRYAGGSTFYYTSIMVKNNMGATGLPATSQTLSLHRSTDFGHTWQGPFEITGATRPRTTTDSADKEFFDIHPVTGRLVVAWTNFIGSGGAENVSTYCDNPTSATPTWSAAAVVFPSTFNGGFPQGIQPRFAPDGSALYAVTNARNATPLDPSGYTQNNEGFNSSTDNGATWGTPTNLLAAPFRMLDQVLGNDRVHSFPFIAVGPSSAPATGVRSRDGVRRSPGGLVVTPKPIYVVYSTNANLDGGDIAFQRSLNGGVSFSAPVLVNSRPGNDRCQWFPTVAVDQSTGRIFITYFDQGIATSGDLTEITVVTSNDGGVTFSKPQPLSFAPFKAGWGNDTGQPNLGDYNQTVAQNGELFSIHAITELKPYGDGQIPAGNANAGSMTTPDDFFRRTSAPPVPSLQLTYFAFPASRGLEAVSFTESGGNGIVDAGDQVKMTIPLRNYVTNPVSTPVTITGISATLSSSDPNVTFLRATSSYPNAAPDATTSNTDTFVFKVGPGFTPGTRLPLTLTVTTNQGTRTFTYQQPTGSPVTTLLLSENFDGVAPGALPVGWTTSHGGGTNTVPWTTSNTAFRPSGSPNNAAFHVNANDATNPTRFERLFSPLITIPTNAEYVTLDMDVAYNTEDDPSYNILCYDGFLLRVTDQSGGTRVLRSVLLEAFAEEFATGALQHYPKHMPRNNSSAYLQDLSAWAGYSGGFKHVRVKLPGTNLSAVASGESLAGSVVQLRFEYTQDSGGTAFDVRPQNLSDPTLATSGVAFDNLVVAAVTSRSVELARLVLTPVSGQPGQYSGVITSQIPAPAGGITAALSSSDAPNTTLPASATIAAGQSVSPSFTVTLAPAGFGSVVTITATGPTNARTAGILVTGP